MTARSLGAGPTGEVAAIPFPSEERSSRQKIRLTATVTTVHGVLEDPLLLLTAAGRTMTRTTEETSSRRAILMTREAECMGHTRTALPVPHSNGPATHRTNPTTRPRPPVTNKTL